jgi:hypothetical protein
MCSHPNWSWSEKFSAIMKRSVVSRRSASLGQKPCGLLILQSTARRALDDVAAAGHDVHRAATRIASLTAHCGHLLLGDRS